MLLLVEGPTEVKTVTQWLRFWKVQHKVLMIPLGGASLIRGNTEFELQQLQRITTKIFALIDSERSAKDARAGEGPAGLRRYLPEPRD